MNGWRKSPSTSSGRTARQWPEEKLITKRFISLIALVWGICFLMGALSHAQELLAFGWRSRSFMPDAFNIYWTALLPLDLTAALLIWWKRRAGIVLGLAIIASDVAVNSYTVFVYGYDQMMSSLVLQSAFLLFVLLTAPLLWRTSKPVT